jgi:hypothetical protein
MQREQVHLVLDVLLDMGERALRRPVSPEAGQHFRNARRETLLGLRTMLDEAIERIDRAPAAAPAGPTKIPVEEA